MPIQKNFNKGTLRGKVVRCELVDFENKRKEKSKFLAMEVNTGNNNRVQATVFNTKTNPNKAKEFLDQYPVGTAVEVTGGVQEREFENKQGKKQLGRSIGANSIKPMTSETKEGATFILQGIVNRIKEIDADASEIEFVIDTSYENDKKEKVKQEEVLHLYADGSALDMMDDLDIEKGDNVKFKGRIFNQLVFDDYGDVTDSVQMLKIERAEDVIKKADIEVAEEVGFL